MSPQRTRIRLSAIYVLMLLNVVLIVAAGAVALYASHIQNQTEQSLYAGCLRGNVLRGVARYVLLDARTVTPEARRLAALPEIVDQPCDVLYPGGK